MALTGTTKIVTDLNYTSTSDALTTPSEAASYTDSESWTSSTADVLYTERKSLAGASYTMDLYGGLTDAFGSTINLTTIREIIIVNRTTTSGYTVKVNGDLIRNASSTILDGWTDDTVSIMIGAGGRFVLSAPVDGFTVTSGTMEDLTLDPGANTVSVDITIIGKA